MFAGFTAALAAIVFRPTTTFHFGQLNMFDTPTIVSDTGQQNRLVHFAGTIARAAPTLDAFTISELDSDSDATDFALHLSAAFGEHWSVTDTTTPSGVQLIGGGMRIATRLPIEGVRVYTFSAADSMFAPGSAKFDGLSAKGVVWARVRREGVPVNIFSAHLQAWGDETSQQVRTQQLCEAAQWIASLNISDVEPVLFGGDFNADDVVVPGFTEIPYAGFSIDPKTNHLVGADGEASANGCISEYENTGLCECCEQSRLDHVLWSGREPTAANASVVRLLADEPVFRGFRDLSDHFMVLADVDYIGLQKLPPRIGQLECHNIGTFGCNEGCSWRSPFEVFVGRAAGCVPGYAPVACVAF